MQIATKSLSANHGIFAKMLLEFETDVARDKQDGLKRQVHACDRVKTFYVSNQEEVLSQKMKDELCLKDRKMKFGLGLSILKVIAKDAKRLDFHETRFKPFKC